MKIFSVFNFFPRIYYYEGFTALKWKVIEVTTDGKQDMNVCWGNASMYDLHPENKPIIRG